MAVKRKAGALADTRAPANEPNHKANSTRPASAGQLICFACRLEHSATGHKLHRPRWVCDDDAADLVALNAVLFPGIPTIDFPTPQMVEEATAEFGLAPDQVMRRRGERELFEGVTA